MLGRLPPYYLFLTIGWHAIDAYKQADGKKIEGRRVLVDVERGRTVPDWKPRRLGGRLGPGNRGPSVDAQGNRIEPAMMVDPQGGEA